jgi:hypothetical protein
LLDAFLLELRERLERPVCPHRFTKYGEKLTNGIACWFQMIANWLGDVFARHVE